MDIQPCGTSESIAFYIAKYIAKNEPTSVDKGLAEAIKQIRNESTDLSKKMFKICMKILNERQVSACECIYRLCHLPMKDSSRRAVFVNTRRPELRYRVLKFTHDETASGFCNNLFDRYENRPNSHPEYDFENMSICEFAMLFEAYYRKTSITDHDEDGDAEAYHDNNEPEARLRLITLKDKSKIKIRTRPAVLSFPHFNISNDRDNYYYSLLIQHTPFRSEIELLQNHLSAEAAFLHNEPILRENNSRMDLYRQRDRELENAFNQLNAFDQLEAYEPPENEEQEEELPDKSMTNYEFADAKAKMNLDQRELFQYITSSIQEQLKGKDSVVKIFITGGAGTGKTFTLKILNEQIKRCYGGSKNTVKIGAPTGAAALLINGQTLHSLFKLPVQKDGKSMPMLLLTGEYLKRIRQQWVDTKFVIIDEISMVSYGALCMIDQRMKQIKNNDELFGGFFFWGTSCNCHQFEQMLCLISQQQWNQGHIYGESFHFVSLQKICVNKETKTSLICLTI